MKRNIPKVVPLQVVSVEKLREIRGGGGNIPVYMHVIKSNR